MAARRRPKNVSVSRPMKVPDCSRNRPPQAETAGRDGWLRKARAVCRLLVRMVNLAGLPQYLDHLLPKYPGHELAGSGPADKRKALTLRSRAANNDPLALEIFDLQAKALGYAVAVGCMAYDPTHIVIGGGLMDREATTPAFRERYLTGVRKAAAEYLWGNPKDLYFHEASLGELSQAIGAAYLSKREYD